MSELWAVALLSASLAGWLGWMLAVHLHRRGDRRSRQRISSNYFRGLNYLLNEEPDKAIEVFLKLAEVNRETVEIHLALGNLFRRRGETDKAIQYHRHIISRPDLSESQRLQALLELGEDYLRAGLLDRAEKLFRELAEQGVENEFAVRQLLFIYQQEKDWPRAIEQAERLADRREGARLSAQFHCELAASALERNDAADCLEHLERARRADPLSVRVALIEGELAWRAGDRATASMAWRRACELDPDIAVLVLDRIVESAEPEATADLIDWLERLSRNTRLLSPVLALTRLEAERDPPRAIERIRKSLESRPSVRGLERLLDLLGASRDGGTPIDPQILRGLLRRLSADQPRFRCRECGFSGQTWHWQCPSCRRWDSTRPVEGVLGE